MCKYCEDMDEVIGENYYPVSGAYGDNMDEEAEVGWYARVNAEAKAVEFNFGFNGVTFINDQFEINYCPMCGRKL
ncbi:MAG: hypothetical protein ACI4FX_01615 [Agathobacter sp.]